MTESERDMQRKRKNESEFESEGNRKNGETG